MHDHSSKVIWMLSKKNSWCALRKGLRALLVLGIGVYKKKLKNRSKNYPKPKNRNRLWSKLKTEYKTIKMEDLYSSIFKTLV